MSLNKRINILVFFTVITISNTSCNEIYKAGNNNAVLGIQIESNINQDVAFKHFDTAKEFKEFQLPENLYDNLIIGNLKYVPNSNKIFYFNENPIEAYHLSSSGTFHLDGVYNPSIGGSNWVNNKSNLTSNDFSRIEERIKRILKILIVSERKNTIPDSIIFINNQYDSLTCFLKIE